MSGTRADGRAYRGSLVVSRTGELYELAWSVDGETWRGAALLINGRLLAVRREAASPGRPGLVYYSLAGGGDLLAFWNAPPIGNRLATGFATGGSAGRVEGDREVTYFDVHGNPLPPLRLRISGRPGGGYDLAWSASPGSPAVYEGIGLAVPWGLVAAWGEPAQAEGLSALAYEVEPGSGGARCAAVAGDVGVEAIDR